jgi:hypothetical protein
MPLPCCPHLEDVERAAPLFAAGRRGDGGAQHGQVHGQVAVAQLLVQLNPPAPSSATHKWRILSLGLARRDRKWPLNDGQIPNPNVVRVALGTGLPSCRGNSAGVAKRPRERSPTRNTYESDSQLLHRLRWAGAREAHLQRRLPAARACASVDERAVGDGVQAHAAVRLRLAAQRQRRVPVHGARARRHQRVVRHGVRRQPARLGASPSELLSVTQRALSVTPSSS